MAKPRVDKESKYAYRGECISQALKAKWAANPKPHYSEQRVCKNCYRKFVVTRRDSPKKYCCWECYDEYSKKYKIRSGGGGKRERAGRSIRGYFKGLYFTSTDQLAFFVYNVNRGMRLYRNRTGFNYITRGGCIKKYIPDFYDDCGIYYEIADMKPNSNRLKAVAAGGGQVVVIDSGLLAGMIDWCLTRFKLRYISDLYEKKDNIIFEYKCAHCGCIFKTSYERKSINRFCSKKCNGQYQFKLNEYNGNINRFRKGQNRRKVAGAW